MIERVLAVIETIGDALAQVPGNLGSQFRSSEIAKKAIEDLRRAQAEAEIEKYVHMFRDRGVDKNKIRT